MAEGWRLLDFYAGRAVVENRNGTLFEVGPGSNLPGLGRVEAVKREDGKIVVVTRERHHRRRRSSGAVRAASSTTTDSPVQRAGLDRRAAPQGAARRIVASAVAPVAIRVRFLTPSG